LGQFKNVKSPGLIREGGELPRHLFGLTIDRVSGDNVRETIIEQLEFLKASNPGAAPPIVRVVLDVDGASKTGVVNREYVTLIQEIKSKNLAFVMAEILDSSYIHYCTKKAGTDADKNCALERTRNYYEALKTEVDIWEVGNEVNGQWAGGASRELDGDDAFKKEKQAARKNARESVTRQVEAAYNYMLLTLTNALAASTCLLAAACNGPVEGQAEAARGGDAGAPPVAQAVYREEVPRLYPVWLKGKIGFIDNTGRLVIPPKFGGEYLWKGGVFSDGMARTAASTLERPGYCCRFGYINAEGRVVVEPRYWEAEDFSEGLAAVAVGDRWGYIDKEGRTVLGPKWVAAQNFSEGLAAVNEDGVGWVFIDKTGATVFKAPYDAPGQFSEGLASVVIDADTQGFIDRMGRLIYKGEVKPGTKFSEGLAPVPSGGRWGYIDRSGRFAIEPAYDWAGGFSGGTAAVGAGGKAWFIDKAGQKVGDCPAQSCNFHEGLAAFESGGRWGYVDKAGRVVIKPQFSLASDFSGGIAMVMLADKKMGYIDKTGRYVWKPTQ
jgi:hypothetical protein